MCIRDSPYLVLLRAGFCLPPVLPQARCALTAPFHHCLCVARACASTARSAVYFLCHYPSSCPDRALPGALPCGVRTFLSCASRVQKDRPTSEAVVWLTAKVGSY